MGEEGVSQALERVGRDEAGRAAVVLAEVLPDLDGQAVAGGKQAGGLDGLRLRAGPHRRDPRDDVGGDEGPHPRHPAVGQPPARDGNGGIDLHFGMGDEDQGHGATLAAAGLRGQVAREPLPLGVR